MDPLMIQSHSERFARIDTLGLNILDILRYHQPIAVVCESPFFNSKRPQAFAALIEATNMIRQTVWAYDRSIGLDLVDPPSVKRAVGAKGNAGKDDVHTAVTAIGELNYEGLLPLSSLDEHSIDAIAVAYSKLIEYRQP
jgi:Holliday junction resolvasome RuvABC endonuclease subunit